jgi:hypothetical protein
MTTKTTKKATPKRASKKPAVVRDAPETVLVLRTCSADLKSDNDFQWPESGPVEAPDWSPTPECGRGLHGWLWGAGDWSMKSKDPGAKWLVVEVAKADVIDLGGKVKFPRGVVVACCDHWQDAMAVIRVRVLRTSTIASNATKDSEAASATGYSGHASATGYYGHASATGYSGHASATGHYGHASATGYSGHASATGYSGHASATGHYGHASATGDYGWAIAGHNGTARADNNGALTLLWWDEKAKRPRVAVGYVGENGIKANTDYCVKNGKLAEVK